MNTAFEDQNPDAEPKFSVPAGFTRATQATENAWHRIEDEFELLTGSEVAARIDPESHRLDLASEMRERGQLLGVNRLDSYPAFQFAADGTVKKVVPELIGAANEAGWSEASLMLWLCNPSGSFGGDRPVDHLDDEGLVDIARNMMTTDW
jgi:hypothetical protein